MLAMAGTGAGSLMTTLRMKEAVQTVGNAMDHARQVAMTSNREVVFRIYKVSNDMGEESWRTVEYGTVDVVINPDDAGYKDPTAADYEPPFNPSGPRRRCRRAWSSTPRQRIPRCFPRTRRIS